MVWTAGDYALIITSTTTAITAITGVGLPLWRDYVAKRDEKKQETYSRISDAVYFCIEHIDDAMELDRHSIVTMAYLEAKKTAPTVDEKLRELGRELSRKQGIIQVIAAELEVGCANFLSAITTIRGTPYVYRLEGGALVSPPENDLVIQGHIKAKQDMITAAAVLLREVRRKLDIAPRLR